MVKRQVNYGIPVSINWIYEVMSSLRSLVVNRTAEGGLVCCQTCNVSYGIVDHSTTSKRSLNGSSYSVFQMARSTIPGQISTTKTSFMNVNKHSHTVPELSDNFALLS